MTDHEVPPCQCPRCFSRLDRAGEIKDEDIAPRPGDLTVCLHCGSINMFDDKMQLDFAPDDKITIEAVAISIVYYKPIVTVFVPGDGKIH